MPSSRVLTPLGIATATAAVVGSVAVYAATRGAGARLSPDSMEYLAGARSLARMDGFTGVDGLPQSLFPPGLSVALVPGVLAGLDDGGARWLDMGLVAATAAGVGVFLSGRVRSGLAVVAAALTALAYPVVVVATWVWSEPLFVALSFVCLDLLATCGTTGRSGGGRRHRGSRDRSGGAHPLLRVTLLPVGVLALLFLPRHGFARRARATVLFAVAVGIVVVPWLVRNLASTGHVAGERFPIRSDLGATADAGATTILNWIVPASAPWPVRVAALLAVAVAVVGAVVGVRRRGRGPAHRARTDTAVVAGGYVVTVFAAMAVIAAGTNINQLGDRLVSPLVIPLIVLLVVAVDRCLDVGGWVVAAAALPLVTAGATLMARTADAVVDGSAGPSGLPVAPLARPGRAGADRRHRPRDQQPTVGGVRAHGRPVAESPRLTGYLSAVVRADDVAQLRGRLAAAGPVRLVWIVGDEEYHLSPEQLTGDGFGVREVVRTPAGAVYEITAE